MRSFEEIARDLLLEKFTGSPLGDLYCTPVVSGMPRLMVRRFNRDLEPALIPAYAGLTKACQEWIEHDTGLRSSVRVAQPVETGEDFIARPHTLGTSIDAYTEDEDPPDAPPELEKMRSAFRSAGGAVSGECQQLIYSVLERSVLKPTAKTVYSFREERFVIADIKPTRGELHLWAAVCQS